MSKSVVNTLKIYEFFIEFDRWGEISGASLNRDKTGFIIINSDSLEKTSQDVEILGMLFNNKVLVRAILKI